MDDKLSTSTGQSLGFFGAYVKGVVELARWLVPSIVSALIISVAVESLLRGHKKEK